jgi:hypothetical protein
MTSGVVAAASGHIVHGILCLPPSRTRSPPWRPGSNILTRDNVSLPRVNAGLPQ